MDHTLLHIPVCTGYTPVKNYFRLWILAEVEQLWAFFGILHCAFVKCY